MSALLAAGCGEDSPGSQPVAESVSEQLRFLDPESSLVTAMDLRFAEDNWEHVQRLASRGLREYRNTDPDAGFEVPPNASSTAGAFRRRTAPSANPSSRRTARKPVRPVDRRLEPTLVEP